MLTSPSCPVCDGRNWEQLGTRTWKRSDLPRLGPVEQRRLRVLYEVWVPQSEEFTATSELCRDCGFVIYAPRPTADEIDAKYRFLTSLGADQAIPPIDSEYTRIRQADLFRVLSRSLPLPRGNRLLDFGGGDGRLLKPFLDRGDTAYIVDYVQQTVPGVTKLGDTLESIAPDERFHGIICSHVLEHVAEPLPIVQQLIRHLTPDGRLFIEVPHEIWKSPPLQPEPVTHVNFFTAGSLCTMLVRAGLHVESCRTEGVELPGVMSVVVRGIARLTDRPDPLPTGGAQAVREFLNPGFLTKLWWISLHPGLLTRAVTARWKRLFGR